MPKDILCLHSSGLSGAQWSRLAKALEPEYRVDAPDLLGYGTCEESYQQPFHYQQDLDRMAGRLRRPSILIGHSYGGYLALHLALRAPSLVRALILFDPIAWGALYSSNGSDPSQLDGPRFMDPQAPPEEWLQSFVDFWGEPGSWGKISARARESMLASFPKLRDEVTSLVQDRTPYTAYQAIDCPTLLLGGQHSPGLQREVMTVLARAIPGAELQWMEAGHMGPLTHHADFQARLLSFLGRLAPV